MDMTARSLAEQALELAGKAPSRWTAGDIIAARTALPALAERVLALEEALRYALDNRPGHSHWREGGSGGRCEACERERQVADRLRKALAAEEPA